MFVSFASFNKNKIETNLFYIFSKNGFMTQSIELGKFE